MAKYKMDITIGVELPFKVYETDGEECQVVAAFARVADATVYINQKAGV